jgi:hypothetical protein
MIASVLPANGATDVCPCVLVLALVAEISASALVAADVAFHGSMMRNGHRLDGVMPSSRLSQADKRSPPSQISV